MHKYHIDREIENKVLEIIHEANRTAYKFIGSGVPFNKSGLNGSGRDPCYLVIEYKD